MSEASPSAGFRIRRAHALESIASADKSRKGSVDAPIRELVDRINASDAMFTTSSCSGRVSLVAESAGDHKGDAEWVLMSHEPLDDPEALETGVARWCKERAAPDRDLTLRFEPFILAAECRALDVGRRALGAAREGQLDGVGQHRPRAQRLLELPA